MMTQGNEKQWFQNPKERIVFLTQLDSSSSQTAQPVPGQFYLSCLIFGHSCIMLQFL